MGSQLILLSFSPPHYYPVMYVAAQLETTLSQLHAALYFYLLQLKKTKQLLVTQPYLQVE